MQQKVLKVESGGAGISPIFHKSSPVDSTPGYESGREAVEGLPVWSADKRGAEGVGECRGLERRLLCLQLKYCDRRVRKGPGH